MHEQMLMNRVLHTAHARGGSNTASNLYVLTYVHFYDIKTSKKKKLNATSVAQAVCELLISPN